MPDPYPLHGQSLHLGRGAPRKACPLRYAEKRLSPLRARLPQNPPSVQMHFRTLSGIPIEWQREHVHPRNIVQDKASRVVDASRRPAIL